MEDTLGKFTSRIAPFIRVKCPKQVLRKIEKQVKGKNEYLVTMHAGVTRKYLAYYNAIIHWPTEEYEIIEQ